MSAGGAATPAAEQARLLRERAALEEENARLRALIAREERGRANPPGARGFGLGPLTGAVLTAGCVGLVVACLMAVLGHD